MPESTPKAPHRRYNPLLDEWILVSPQRSQRPWQGSHESVRSPDIPAHDPDCYLCPGNLRANGQRNPHYDSTFVFRNDFPALLPGSQPDADAREPLLQWRSVQGEARVICFSPRHDLTLAEMAIADIETVIDLWARQTAELGQLYRWVQVFENRGAMMGASNPHPHGQIWATDSLGSIPEREDRQQRDYLRRQGRALLLDYARLECERGERVVLQNEHWLAVVPYWALWPYETLLLPKAHTLRLPQLSPAQMQSLARILKRLLVRYDNLFQVSFPYSMGWHGAPYGQGAVDHWQLHAHIFPPLLRSATVKKFMVGYEMLAEAQRDITAEQAADRLRGLSDRHFKLG